MRPREGQSQLKGSRGRILYHRVTAHQELCPALCGCFINICRRQLGVGLAGGDSHSLTQGDLVFLEFKKPTSSGPGLVTGQSLLLLNLCGLRLESTTKYAMWARGMGMAWMLIQTEGEGRRGHGSPRRPDPYVKPWADHSRQKCPLPRVRFSRHCHCPAA